MFVRTGGKISLLLGLISHQTVAEFQNSYGDKSLFSWSVRLKFQLRQRIGYPRILSEIGGWERKEEKR